MTELANMRSRRTRLGCTECIQSRLTLPRTGKPDLAFLNYYTEYKPPTVTVLLHK